MIFGSKTCNIKKALEAVVAGEGMLHPLKNSTGSKNSNKNLKKKKSLFFFVKNFLKKKNNNNNNNF
jgi:hypothetical protein